MKNIDKLIITIVHILLIALSMLFAFILYKNGKDWWFSFLILSGLLSIIDIKDSLEKEDTIVDIIVKSNGSGQQFIETRAKFQFLPNVDDSIVITDNFILRVGARRLTNDGNYTIIVYISTRNFEENEILIRRFFNQISV